MKNIIGKLPRWLNLKALIFAGVLVLGFALGLVWGWVIQPVEWSDADPSYLSAQYQDDYFRLVVDSYRVNAKPELAKQRLDILHTDVEALYQSVAANPGSLDPNFLLLFGKFLSENGYITSGQLPVIATGEAGAAEIVATENGTVIATDGAENSGVSATLVIIASIFAVGLSGFAIYSILRRRNRAFEDEYEDEYDDSEDEPAVQERKFATPLRRDAQQSTQAPHRESYAQSGGAASATSSEKQPFARYQATYLIGNDDFNESYSIDSRTGEYLGECGFGVSEFMGVGTPKKASAFEVWMFDKNDIQTVTKVLLTPFLFNDYNSRARLEPKGELIEVKPGKQIRLETATLFMIATIQDMKFGEGISADKSYLDQISMDLSIWKK